MNRPYFLSFLRQKWYNKNMDDGEFVRRCVKGDKQAWDEFVNRYSRLIYNCIHKILAVYGRDQASSSDIPDIFQEVFLLLSRNKCAKLATFQGRNGATLASWLRQVTINYTVSYLRTLKPLLSLDQENEEGLTLGSVVPDPGESSREAVFTRERVDGLAECIEGLDAEDKYLVSLQLNRHLSLEEIRCHLNITRGAVDMRKSRIIERLKECLKKKGFVWDFQGSVVY